MNPLWMLKADHDAPGWRPLEKDARSGATDLLLYDRNAWALIRAAAAPTQYEGMTAVPAPTGLYLDPQGNPIYVVNSQQVKGPFDVLAALGPDAQELFKKIGDPVVTLERLGRAF